MFILKIMKSVLSMFRDNLLNLNQFDIFFYSVFVFFPIVQGLCGEQDICVVSKNYKMGVRWWEGKIINVK